MIGVGAIYPGDEDKMYCFKKNTVGSQKQSLPKYFSLAIVGENNGDTILKNRLTELLEVVKVIEKENENVEVTKERAEQLSVTGRKNNVQNANVQIDTTLASVEETFSKDKHNIKYSAEKEVADDKEALVIKADGKKCFYYAKNMCMYQKSRCSIADEPCAFYVSKKSKRLLKEEDTCRNFIHYTRRGKVNRVECSVSRLPGCIGSYDCKFYMRKNKSKK